MGVLPLLAEHDLSALRVILCGGSAVPKALSENYRKAIGIPMLHAWGMTETSPIATICRPQSEHDDADRGRAGRRAGPAGPGGAAGRPAGGRPGHRRAAALGRPASGEIQLAGPWIAAEYYRGEGGGAQFTADGWLRTGDVAAVDGHGYVRLVDRTKDLIKSGGEWIGSVELENEIMAHPKVAEAAVIAIPHERWVERPLACVVVKPGETLTAAEVLEFLTPRVAKWWLPDAVEFIDEVPKTSVGKFSKKTLREKFAGLPAAGSGRVTRLQDRRAGRRVLAGPARCGDTRLVCVDGRPGRASRRSRGGWPPRSAIRRWCTWTTCSPAGTAWPRRSRC